jgi:hypothetical protein
MNKRRQRHKKANKKSQVWVSDYIIGLLLFVLAIIFSVKIIINSFSTNVAFNEMKNDASKISEILLSEGYPPDWNIQNTQNCTDIIRLGLLTAKRLDSEKVLQAMNATYISYDSLRTKLQAKHDFVVIFENTTNGDMIEFGDDSFCTIGSSSVTINKGSPVDCHNISFTSISYKNMVRLSRFIIYNSTIIRMVVYTWG